MRQFVFAKLKSIKARHLALVALGVANVVLFQNCSNYSGQVALAQLNGLGMAGSQDPLLDKGDSNLPSMDPSAPDAIDTGESKIIDSGSSSSVNSGGAGSEASAPSINPPSLVANPAPVAAPVSSSNVGDLCNAMAQNNVEKVDISKISLLGRLESEHDDEDRDSRDGRRRNHHGDREASHRDWIDNKSRGSCHRDEEGHHHLRFEKAVLLINSSPEKIIVDELSVAPGSTICGNIEIKKLSSASGNSNAFGQLKVSFARIGECHFSGKVETSAPTRGGDSAKINSFNGNAHISIDSNGKIWSVK